MNAVLTLATVNGVRRHGNCDTPTVPFYFRTTPSVGLGPESCLRSDQMH